MRTLLRGFGELAVTAGLLLALLVAYLVWGTGDYTRRQQGSLTSELERQWRHTSSSDSRRAVRNPDERAVRTVALSAGRAFAVIRVPRFGAGYRFAVVEGVGPADLRKGPGHYPGTASPGEVGNMVISGHRTTYGAPFSRAGELVQGDEILIDTAATTFAYRVTGRMVVRPSATQVTEPVPLQPGRKPRKRLLTLTTCHPKFSAAYRLIVFAELLAFRPR